MSELTRLPVCLPLLPVFSLHNKENRLFCPWSGQESRQERTLSLGYNSPIFNNPLNLLNNALNFSKLQLPHCKGGLLGGWKSCSVYLEANLISRGRRCSPREWKKSYLARSCPSVMHLLAVFFFSFAFFFKNILFHYSLSWDMEQSSFCCAVVLCCLFFMHNCVNLLIPNS